LLTTRRLPTGGPGASHCTTSINAITTKTVSINDPTMRRKLDAIAQDLAAIEALIDARKVLTDRVQAGATRLQTEGRLQ